MCRTFIRIILIVCFLGALPSQAFGLDFDKEIQKQNRIYQEITGKVGQDRTTKPRVAQRDTKVSEFKVVLLPAAKNR